MPAVYWTILAAVSALCLLGIIMVLSSTTVLGNDEHGDPYYFFRRQVLWLGLGIVAMFLTQVFGYQRLRFLVLPGLAATVALLVGVLFVGTEVNGSVRWVEIGGTNLQPSELAKFVMILWTAALIATRKRHLSEWRRVLAPICLMLGLVSLLIVAEPDLGTVFILGAVIGAIVVVAGIPLHQIGFVVLITSPLLALASVSGYHSDRWAAFDSSADVLGKNYQLTQALSSVANGGWLGVGPGASSAKWGYLPEAHKDVIFAVVTEELGVVGAVAIIALFAILVGAAYQVHRRTTDVFGSLVALGIGVWIGIQAMVNIGVTLGVLPNKGLTLPFVSYGGSSLLVMLCATGMLLSIAAKTR